tara:strand:- start:130 stop:306 length:177 start_codon:yes stop_codon:yes gene_type:complete
MVKKNKTPNLIEGRTKEWNDDNDYYNRSSIGTSYTIAVISLAIIVVLLIGVGILKLIG